LVRKIVSIKKTATACSWKVRFD